MIPSFSINSATRWGLNIFLLLAGVVALRLAESVIIPLLIALLLACVLGPAAAWLHRVAVNIARTGQARLVQRRAHERQAVHMAEVNAVDEVALRDWRPLIHEEVDRLPERYARHGR